MNTETIIPKKLNAFGKEYVFQAVIIDSKDLADNVANWKKAGHNTMIKKGNRLYVTQDRIRNF